MKKSGFYSGKRGPIIIIDGKKVTPCQARVISLGTLGIQRKTIAHHLGNSKHTIDTHLDRIYKLLDIHDGRQLVAWALAHRFDLRGNLMERYLFTDFKGLPWETDNRE